MTTQMSGTQMSGTQMLFIGPHPISGIGQVMLKYAKSMKGDHLVFGDQLHKKYDYIIAFTLPIDSFISAAIDYRGFAMKKFYIISICETLQVHPGYGLMFKEFPNIITPSNFCKDIFDKQFGVNCKMIPLYHDPVPDHIPVSPTTCYTFYTIGNMADPRKNIKMLIEAFIRCNFGSSAKLLLKATCRDPYILNIPNIQVINGLLSDEDLELHVHQKGHCYINCSHSEGVGMGAVEAALRNKPVIITDFGGLKEYVTTPFTISCVTTELGRNAEFLFTPEMEWGQPSIEQLIQYMTTCFNSKITRQEHPETVSKVNESIRFFCHDECNNTCMLD